MVLAHGLITYMISAHGLEKLLYYSAGMNSGHICIYQAARGNDLRPYPPSPYPVHTHHLPP